MNTQPGAPAGRSRPGLWNRWPATTIAGLGGLTALAVLLAAPPPPEPVPQLLAAIDDLEPSDEASSGTRHKGEEGRMGTPTRHRGEAGMMGKPVPRAFDPEMAARSAGILGVMAAEKGHYLASPYGGAFAVGSDDADVWGGLTGTEIGEAYGVGGLGLVGTGRGGGGTGDGTIGLGHGSDSGSSLGRTGTYDASLHSGRLTVGTVDDNAQDADWKAALATMATARRPLGIADDLWHKGPPQRRHADKPTHLDIALVVDTTGSMGDELEYLKVEIRDIARRVDRDFPDVAQRWGLVVYRDRGDDYVTRRFDFTNIDKFVTNLGNQEANGGGDTPEAMDAALAASEQLAWRAGDDTARMIFLVADAPTHTGSPARKFASSVLAHRAAKTAIYPVAGSGVHSQAEAELRLAARATGGQYIFLTDHSGVGGKHDEAHVPQYTVESLHDAMARMIRGELGNPAPAQPPADPPAPAPDPAPQPAPDCDEPPATTVIAIPVVAAAAVPDLWDELKTRVAAHLLLVASLSLVVLAAMGLDTWIRRRRRMQDV